MEIREILNNKKDFMDILLLGDEEESMIDKYLEKGSLFALYDNENLRTACVTIQTDSTTIEIKNIVTCPNCQNRGYASALIEFICNKYKEEFLHIILGTGENDLILNFYKKRGFVEFDKVKDFFIKNYDHPIFENNKQLIDMIYLKRKLR